MRASKRNCALNVTVRALPQNRDEREPVFQQAAGRPLSPIPDDTLAGSIGGPIYIPKVYIGTNRTFFFVAGVRVNLKNLKNSP